MPPKTLGAAGKQLWRRIVGDLADGWRLDERELRALELAGRCADDMATLEKAIAKDGSVVRGSMGQLRPHPGLDVLVRLRTLETALLRPLELAPAAAAKTASQQRAQAAVSTRWANVAKMRGVA